MKKILILAGAVAFAATSPALAEPGKGKGKGNSHDKVHVHHDDGKLGYGAGGCPPGLAKKNNGCMPPGKAKQLYRVGQVFPRGYGYPWTFNQIPYNLRTQYGFNPNHNYYYGDGYVYRVNPATMLISQVVSAALN